MAVEVRRETFDPPRPVWLRLRVSSWQDDVEVPAWLHEWEGRGLPEHRTWKGRVTVDDNVETPASWNPRYPWVPADQLRRRDP